MSWKTLDEKVFSKVSDKPLYHYTDQKGLLGILGDKEIWLTHSQYLNDHKEFLLAVEMVKEQVEILKSDRPDSESQEIIEIMLGNLDGLHQANVMVCSFSEEPDSLSQWRAYGGKSGGFAIGFPGETLFSDFKNTGIHFGKCIYDKDEQRNFIQEIVNDVFDTHKNWPKDGQDDYGRRLPNQLIPNLLRYAALLKHKSFEAEKEWRFITSKGCSDRNFDFRPGPSTIIPYYKKSLLNEKQELSLHEIIVGPTQYPKLSAEAVTSLLISQDDPKNEKGEIQPHIVWHARKFLNPSNTVPMRLSDVPYRNWQSRA